MPSSELVFDEIHCRAVGHSARAKQGCGTWELCVVAARALALCLRHAQVHEGRQSALCANQCTLAATSRARPCQRCLADSGRCKHGFYSRLVDCKRPLRGEGCCPRRLRFEQLAEQPTACRQTVEPRAEPSSRGQLQQPLKRTLMPLPVAPTVRSGIVALGACRLCAGGPSRR